MSFKKATTKPPARPPPPKGGISLGGMSFKKLELEEEDEEEDLTISDKYTTLLQQARASPSDALGSAKSSSSSLSSLSSSKAADASENEEGAADRSSPQRKVIGGKTMHEYKEMFSGLKGKIQEKISKRIEDFSGGESRDSSANTTPDKEHPPSNSTTTAVNDDIVTKVAAVKLKAAPSSESVKSAAKTLESAAVKVESGKSSSTDGPARPNSVPVRAVSEERLPTRETSLERNASSVPVKLSALAMEEDQEEDGDGDILVFEEHFTREEPFEDFAGGLTTSTAVRSRGKLKIKKKAPKTTATVSLSGLMKTPGPEGEGGDGGGVKKAPPPPALYLHQQDSVTPTKTSSFMRLVSHDGQSIQWPKVVAMVACLFAYFIVPLPSYLSGVIAGCVLTSLGWVVYIWLTEPPRVREPPALIPIEKLPPMEVPEMKEPSVQEDGVYKGWMNEITSYNPDDYHINHTYSVFVTLEGAKLRLQRPKTPIPRRAMHDEVIPTAHFIHQRHFDLNGSKVMLQPPGLVKKRVWSKKYPICICLAEMGTKIHNRGDSSVDPAPPSAKRGNDMGFELISEEKCDSSLLFLFARTCREKEEWYRRFVAATLGKPLSNPVLEMRRAIERYRQMHHKRVGSDGAASINTRQRHDSTDSQSSTTSDKPAESKEAEQTEPATSDPMIDFTRYMGHLMPAGAFNRLLSPAKTKDTGSSRLPFTGSIICDSQLYWLNALIGRCFYDFLRDGWWAEKVKDKLQRKLSKIHVPYFIEELQVTAIDMGKEMPVVRRAANPYLDDRGFWVELDISYGGGFQMTIETKMNLMKLKKAPQPAPAVNTQTSERSPVTDSEEEDSAESSTDEEEEAASPEDKESGGGKKLLKYLDKLTSTKYFQQATEYKYIKRAMESVSNTPLQLQVSVKHLVGKLVINVPPPPSDRLWYGFRGPPRLWLSAKPQVGERKVTITHVTEWIERKLESEFQRVFVLPNMDDLVIPILRANQSSGEPEDDDEASS